MDHIPISWFTTLDGRRLHDTGYVDTVKPHSSFDLVSRKRRHRIHPIHQLRPRSSTSPLVLLSLLLLLLLKDLAPS